MKPLNEIKLKIQSRPENIGIARVTVAAFIAQIDLTVDELEDIKVAVSEAVSNSIIHGYGGKEEEWIEIQVSRFDSYFLITVEDWGKGIENIQEAMEPAFSTDAQRMGLGFVFMQSFMDEVEVSSQPGVGTLVRLKKNWGPKPYAPN